MARPNILRPLLLALLLLIAACDTQARMPRIPKLAGDSYKAHKDYASLEIVYRYLSKDMEQGAVKELLGEPDYSPIAGQYYYSSDLRKTELRGKEWIEVTVGLIVDYRDKQGEVTKQLQTFRLDSIGE